MPTKPVIAISGPPGSGKTTYAKRLSEELGWPYYSAGTIFRRMAQERGLSLTELSILAEKDPEIDLEIDKRTIEIGLSGRAVIEGHLVAWVLKDIASIKIYVTAPLLVRVRRIAARDRKDFMEVLRETSYRERSQQLRFYKYYGINVSDLSIFDMVLDTSRLSIDAAYNLIRSYIKEVIDI